MRERIIALSLALTILASAATASNPSSNIAPSYIAVGGGLGTVLPTCDFFEGDYAIPIYATQSIKYVYTSPGDNWQQIAYGMPYYGVGLAVTEFGRPESLGTPVSLYLVQGATLRHIQPRLSLNYELNLGMSTNWQPYDPFDNRENDAIGSTMNVHVAAGIYLKWYLSQRTDIHLGASVFHASNGSSVQPNLGINTASLYFELTHNFNRDQLISRYNPTLEIPPYDPHFEHDVQFILSSKNVEADLEGAPVGVNTRQFDVYGINYYSMHSTSYKYRYGLGVELLYDESSNATIYQKYSEIDDIWYEVTNLASMRERLSVGIALRGEIVRPLYSIFADVGLSIIQPNDNIKRFYQSVGVKVPLERSIYGTFGIRATDFSQAQFLYWSIGYTFNSKRQRLVPGGRR